jgi:hypothetical protein
VRSFARFARFARFTAVAPVALLFVRAGAAQAEELPRNAIVADLGLHVIGLGAQRTLRPWITAQIALEFYSPWTQTKDVFGLAGQTQSDVAGVALRERFFIYPFEKAPTGLWISPFAQFGAAGSTDKGETRIGSLGAIGVSAGYSLLLWNKVYVALGIGGQYHAVHFQGDVGPPSFAGFFPTVDGNLGYAF